MTNTVSLSKTDDDVRNNGQIVLENDRLSVLSKRYLNFRNIYGFRPLLFHPTLSKCLPYQAARVIRRNKLHELYQERNTILQNIEKNIKSQKIAEIEHNIQQYTESYNQEQDTAKKQTYKTHIEAEQRHLKRLKEKSVTFTDVNHPDLLKIDERIEKMRHARMHIQNSGTCQGCGVSLPDSIEKHIDFLTAETRLLCPFCHLTEHLDEAAELKAGYVGYMPNISQEQINLFTYCYFILHYIIEDNAHLSEEERQKYLAFGNSLISENIKGVTYNVLLEQIKQIYIAMLESGNKLTGLFKHLSRIDPNHLRKEYEEKNHNVNANAHIDTVLRQEEQVYQISEPEFLAEPFYSINIDKMSSPAFWAGLLISNGISINGATSAEEKLNMITRLDGLRFIPSYAFFRPYLGDWQKTLLNEQFKYLMSSFFVPFEELLAVEANLDKSETVQNSKNDNQTKSEKENIETPTKAMTDDEKIIAQINANKHKLIKQSEPNIESISEPNIESISEPNVEPKTESQSTHDLNEYNEYDDPDDYSEYEIEDNGVDEADLAAIEADERAAQEEMNEPPIDLNSMV